MWSPDTVVEFLISYLRWPINVYKNPTIYLEGYFQYTRVENKMEPSPAIHP